METDPVELTPCIHLRIAQEEDFVENEDANCPICINRFQVGDEIAKTRCAHVYHVLCLNRWLADVFLKEPNMPVVQKENRRHKHTG